MLFTFYLEGMHVFVGAHYLTGKGPMGLCCFLISNTLPYADALRCKKNSEPRGSSMAGEKVFPSRENVFLSEKNSVRPSVFRENY
jgi:hypothetical protein